MLEVLGFAGLGLVGLVLLASVVRSSVGTDNTRNAWQNRLDDLQAHAVILNDLFNEGWRIRDELDALTAWRSVSRKNNPADEYRLAQLTDELRFAERRATAITEYCNRIADDLL